MWGWARRAADVVMDAVRVPSPLVLDLQPTHTFDTAPRPVDRVLAAMRDGTGSVSRETALQVAAVLRGRNELCSIATLPLRQFLGLNVMDAALFRQFDPDVPNVVHMSMTIEDLVFEAVAWWQVTARDFEGYPMAVKRIDPRRVKLDPPNGRRLPAGARPDRYVWIDFQDGRGYVEWPAADVIRFDSPNPALLRAQARAIRIAGRLDTLTEMYAANPALREYFTDADDLDTEPMDDDAIDQFLAEYGAMRQTRPYGWIPSTVKRSDVSSPSPRDLTLVELRQQAHLAIANGMGVDPEDLGVAVTSRTYFNSVDKKQDKINRTYAPYMSAITDRLTMGDVTKRGYRAGFDLTDYLKSSPAEQAAYWKALQDMGVTDSAEIRGWAGLSGRPPAAPAPAAAPAVESAGRPAIQLGNITPGRRLQLDSGGPAFTFDRTDFAAAPDAPTVDTDSRTITGLAVPYNAVANKYGLKYSFAPGSLEYSEPGRMPHLMDHMTPVGFHRKITDSAAGPVVELAVLEGREGSPAKFTRDQLLDDAAAGLYNGLSVGVDFSLDPEDGDVEITDDGVIRVLRATWRETSTTYLPAFDDARVTKVAASMTGGNPVHCPHCGHAHAPNMACATFAALQQQLVQPAPGPAPAPNPPGLPGPDSPPPTPDPAAVAAFSAFMAWQQQAAGPVAVNPHHGAVVVSEARPYVFDAAGRLKRGTHSFAQDLVAAAKRGDQGAKDRISSFIREVFADPGERARQIALSGQPDSAAHGFAVTPANVAGLNPNRQRPDLYVDQMEYGYPMWDAVQKGTLDDITPFTLPKYNTSSGLVADHVSGTEPTPGAFTVTTQTITPTPVSGKLEVLREAVDQIGNPAMDGILWRQMVRAYYEALEAYVQAQFVAAAASIPDITITTAAVDGALDQAIKAALVPLQFIRGGNRFRRVFTQIDLYKAMVAAKDTAGRALYPTLGPTNASGTVEDGYTAIDAHGMLWIPAWATAATGTAAASSWTFDPDKVWAAASAPERIDIEWRVAWLDIGIWGYKAMGIIDFAGTREISYDPV